MGLSKKLIVHNIRSQEDASLIETHLVQIRHRPRRGGQYRIREGEDPGDNQTFKPRLPSSSLPNIPGVSIGRKDQSGAGDFGGDGCYPKREAAVPVADHDIELSGANELPKARINEIKKTL
jgi:hypothetical protein